MGTKQRNRSASLPTEQQEQRRERCKKGDADSGEQALDCSGELSSELRAEAAAEGKQDSPRQFGRSITLEQFLGSGEDEDGIDTGLSESNNTTGHSSELVG